MGTIETFTTEGLPLWQRRHFWNEVNSRVFTPLESTPRYPKEFNARLSRMSLGSVSFSQAISDAAELVHTVERARQSTEQVFLLHLQARGACVNRQDGRFHVGQLFRI